ncbi:hypothetical protein ACFE04_025269 [Oxalis oulophora]
MPTLSELGTPLTQSKGSSFFEACFNATNAFLGIGLLTVPYAIASGGWLSLFLFFLVVTICFYTGILLRRCMDYDPSIRTYLDIGEQAYGKKCRIFVMILINLELYLYAIGLLILEGDNLHKLFPEFAMGVGKFAINGRQSFVLITAIVVLPSMLLTDLSYLSYVSATGVISCIFTLVSIFCVGAFGGVGFHQTGNILNIRSIPIAVSLFNVCFAGHTVVPSIYVSMRNRYQFNEVLFCSFVITTIIYLLMGIIGYLMYGDSAEPQITLNLPTRLISSKIAIYTVLLIPITRYALVMTPVATTIEGLLSEDLKNWRKVIRVSLLLSTTILAFLFPYFENLMSSIGSIFVVMGSFVLPCLCYLKISGTMEYPSLSSKSIVMLYGIVLFAILVGILGTYSSITELVKNM